VVPMEWLNEKFKIVYNFITSSKIYYIIAVTLIGILSQKLLYFFTVKWLGRKSRKNKSKYYDVMADALAKPLSLLIVLISVYVSLKVALTGKNLLASVNVVFNILLVLALSYTFSRFIERIIKESAYKYEYKKGSSVKRQIIFLVARFSNVIIWIIGIIVAIKRAGYSVTTLITALGIGGAGIALASKNSFLNIFGATTLIFDKTFYLGDYVKIGDNTGFVEDLRISNTKLRTLDDSLVVIPNSKITELTVENFSTRKKFRISGAFSIKLTAEKTKLEIFLQDIREYLNADENTAGEIKVNLSDIQSNIKISYDFYIKNQNTEDFKERFIFKIMELASLSSFELA
jgi:MscS family membrane protein